MRTETPHSVTERALPPNPSAGHSPVLLLAAHEDEPAAEDSLPAALHPEYIMLQLFNANALHNGDKTQLESGFGLPVRPYYYNELSMIPLRIVSEAFGYSVTWEDETQTVTVTGATLQALFTVGETSAVINAESRQLGAPVELLVDTVYVPARVFSDILGCYIHYYDKHDGEFLLISNAAVTAGDLLGPQTANDSFDSSLSDTQLLKYKTLGDTYLGPSLYMYTSGTLFLKSNCAYALNNGTPEPITSPGACQIAPILKDGDLYVPVEYCAQSFGAQTQLTADGALSVTYEGHMSVFPIAAGYYTHDGIAREDSRYITWEFDTVVYSTVQAVASAMGLSYTDAGSDTVVLSAYNPGEYDNLGYYTQLKSAELQQQPVIKGYISLTFDDGPSGDITARLLDGLAQRNIHVTFFLCNYRIAQNQELMQRYLLEGHEVANHSASHPNMTSLSGREIETEIDSTNTTLQSYSDAVPHLFRPPGGAYNERMLSALTDRSMSCILWSVDPKDWRDHDSQLVSNRILSAATDGSIILLHDMYNTSVDAGLYVIDKLQAEGYKFVTVSDLAFVKGYELVPGQVYTSFK